MAKEFPSQKVNRLRLIIETIRDNQELFTDLLIALRQGDDESVRLYAHSLYGTERYALTHPEGILSDEQRRRIFENL